MHPADALQESKGYIVNNYANRVTNFEEMDIFLGKKKQNPLEKLVGVDT